MLPIEMGRYTMERAAVHEAAHAVSIWLLGGTVVGIEVAYDDGTGEWQGGTADDGLPSEAAKIEVYLAGGMGEALYVANVYDAEEWIMDEPPTRAALLGAYAAPGAPIDIAFRSATGGTKVVRFEADTFSNDLFRANQSAGQHGLALPSLITNAIIRLNTPNVWRQILEMANRFLLRPPRILTWRYGPDADVQFKKYQIGPIAEATMVALKN